MLVARSCRQLNEFYAASKYLYSQLWPLVFKFGHQAIFVSLSSHFAVSTTKVGILVDGAEHNPDRSPLIPMRRCRCCVANWVFLVIRMTSDKWPRFGAILAAIIHKRIAKYRKPTVCVWHTMSTHKTIVYISDLAFSRCWPRRHNLTFQSAPVHGHAFAATTNDINYVA